MSENYKKELIKSIIGSEFKPKIVERDKVNLSLFDSIPFVDLSVLGATFIPVIQSLQSLGSQFLGTSPSTNNVLYSVKLPEGATHLAMKKDGSGFITAAFDNSNNLVGQASMVPEGMSGKIANTPKINPYMIAVAASLLSINAKLNDIKQSQDNILDFLEQKEKSILEGNLNFLSDILNNYKSNWNNEKYINSNHIKVLDIKQQSEQSISLLKKQVKTVIKEGTLFHTTRKVSKNINDLLARLDDYRLSIYMYAFSSYVDVLLLENFESEFLQKIVNKISKYALEYREIYTDVYTALERFTKRSVRSIASRGAAETIKVLGKTVEKIPKLRDTQIDENLLEASERIKEFDIDTNQKISRTITNCQKVDVSPFVDNINQIDYLYNSQLIILISNDRFYISKKTI